MPLQAPRSACRARRTRPARCWRSETDRPPPSGEKPRPIRIDPVTATGVPKPDAPSKNAPKAKAMSRSCSRRSGVMSPIDFCMIANQPFSTVSRYRKMTFRMIQPIGKNPVSAPSATARTAIPAGHPKSQYGDQHSNRERDQRSDMNLDLACGDQDKQKCRRYCGRQRRKHAAAERIITLIPHWLPLSVLTPRPRVQWQLPRGAPPSPSERGVPFSLGILAHRVKTCTINCDKTAMIDLPVPDRQTIAPARRNRRGAAAQSCRTGLYQTPPVCAPMTATR